MLMQQLIYFSKIAEYQNISRASEMLYVSQPTLSRTVKQLEEEMGCQLFERKGRSLLLTESGKILLQRAREIITLVEQTEDELRRFSLKEAPVITVQLRCVAGLFYDLFAQYKKPGDDTEFNILQSDNEGINNNRYDIFLYPSDSEVNTPFTTTLFRENVYIAMSVSHPLAEKEIIELDDLRGCQYVSIAGNRIFNRISGIMRAQSKYLQDCKMYCDDMVAVRNLVRDQMYLSHMPEFTWQKKDLDGIVFKSIRGLEMHRYVCMAVNSIRPLSPRAEAFRTFLLKEFQKVPSSTMER